MRTPQRAGTKCQPSEKPIWALETEQVGGDLRRRNDDDQHPGYEHPHQATTSARCTPALLTRPGALVPRRLRPVTEESYLFVARAESCARPRS